MSPLFLFFPQTIWCRYVLYNCQSLDCCNCSIMFMSVCRWSVLLILCTVASACTSVYEVRALDYELSYAAEDCIVRVVYGSSCDLLQLGNSLQSTHDRARNAEHKHQYFFQDIM